MAARREALKVAARTLEHHLNADTRDKAGSTLACSCGQLARYAGRHAKEFETVLGTLRLRRAYYHCEACEGGFCPRDRELGLEGTSVSPGVTRMIGTVASMVSFAEGSDLLSELAGVKVVAKQVERVAEALGKEIAEDERRNISPEPPSAPTLYLGLDGTGIPMRKSELAGRAGKQPDGSAKTREVKLCTLWTAESRDKEGKPVRDHGSISYSAAIESVATKDTVGTRSEFTERVMRETARRGFERAQRRVVLGDGAAWIWNLADEHFPEAIQVVDLFHAKQHLSDVAKAVYGAGTHLAEAWAERRHAELDEGRFDTLLAALNRQADRSEEARLCLNYLRTNRHRMRYPEFRKQGLCTSTGVVEAGCKVAIGTRLKRAGMHWTVPGANAIIALRCTRLSGRFEDFWSRRSQKAVGQ
jgi:hypothetical protein